MKLIKTSAIGIMSGTSLDGLDLAYCKFTFDGKWHFQLLETACVKYDPFWKDALEKAHLLAKEDLDKLNLTYGTFIGDRVNDFIQANGLNEIDLVCSHGHTIFHDPDAGYTLQIGDGGAICTSTGIDTVSDFRTLDVKLGGQGAPLVPIGDELLFDKYDACLNLGGFSNISFRKNEERIAFDISPVNIVLNPLAQKFGMEYDNNGDLSRSGNVDEQLLEQLNGLAIYKDNTRPSFSREWLEQFFQPLITSSDAENIDLLRTITEHSAIQISDNLNQYVKTGSVLITGGGAKNKFIIERIQALCKAKVILPDEKIIDYKEALIFAFLGVLRSKEMINVLRTVTGATENSSSGTLHYANKI